MWKLLIDRLVSFIHPSQEEWHAQIDRHYDEAEDRAAKEAGRKAAEEATGLTSGPEFEREAARVEARHRELNAIAREATRDVLSPQPSSQPEAPQSQRPSGADVTVYDLPGFEVENDRLVKDYQAELLACADPADLASFVKRWEAVFRLWKPSKDEKTVSLDTRIAELDFDLVEALECAQALSSGPCQHSRRGGSICVGSELRIPWSLTLSLLNPGPTVCAKLLRAFPVDDSD